jgi:hypothetical protein
VPGGMEFDGPWFNSRIILLEFVRCDYSHPAPSLLAPRLLLRTFSAGPLKILVPFQGDEDVIATGSQYRFALFLDFTVQSSMTMCPRRE